MQAKQKTIAGLKAHVTMQTLDFDFMAELVNSLTGYFSSRNQPRRAWITTAE